MKRALALSTLILAACPASPGPSHPQRTGDCSALETAQACSDAPGCRYLEPGCAEGDERPMPGDAAGCYPTAPCSTATCPDGTCTTVIVNPCLPGPDGTACDACGEPVSVCLK